MKKAALVILIFFFAISIYSCGLSSSDKTPEGNLPKPTVTAGNNPAQSPSVNPEESEIPLTDAEKQAAEYEKIAQEALDNEHEHVWVFSHYQERHPHEAEYKCECGAMGFFGSKKAYYTMTIIGPSEEHPHYMVEECSLCEGHFVNENLPTELKWVLDGYTDEHPHYGKVKCTKCDYYEINKAITTHSMEVSQLVVDGYEEEHPHHPIIKCSYKGCDHNYVEKNSTSVDTGFSKLIVAGYTEEHPHYPIVKCTFEGCNHNYIEKNSTAEWEIETNSDNYSIAHPHFIIGTCSNEGCSYTEKTNMIADWEWEDGVCSICGGAKDVLYKNMYTHVIITGPKDPEHEGPLVIPREIEHVDVFEIGSGAFAGQVGITEITIPDTIDAIWDEAFSDCVNALFNPTGVCPVCQMLHGSPHDEQCDLKFIDILPSEANIPISYYGKNLNYIGMGVFRNCMTLESVVLGPRIRTIGDLAFEGCLNLRQVIILAMQAPEIHSNIFAGTHPEFRIFIPEGAVGYDTPEWEQFEIVYLEPFELH